MTEDLRKLAQFFLKKFPLDVNLRHAKKPEHARAEAGPRQLLA